MRNAQYHIFFLLLWLCLSISPCQAQPKTLLPFQSTAAQKALKQIYNFQFKQAQESLASSQSGIGKEDAALLNIFLLKWQYKPLHDQPAAIQDLYLEKLKACKETMEDASAPLSELEKIFTNMSFAEFYFNKKSYFKALSYGSSAYSLMKKHITETPTTPTDYFISGIYLYYRDYYADHNKLFASMLFFFPDGNQTLGKKFLQHCLTKGSFLQTEALIVLTHIHLYLENKPQQAQAYTTTLTHHFPGNLKFQELQATALLSAGNYEEASNAVSLLLKSSANYYRKKGEILKTIQLEQQGQLDTALAHYKSLVQEIAALPGQHLQWEALIYAGLARCYSAQGLQEKADEAWQACRNKRTYIFNLTTLSP